MSAMTNEELIRLGRALAAVEQSAGHHGNAKLITQLTDALEADEAKLEEEYDRGHDDGYENGYNDGYAYASDV